MHGQRILIVEDEELVSFTLAKLLNTRGYDAAIVGSVSSAIDALEAAIADTRPFAHVLLDLKLPDADGENVLLHVERMQLRPNVIVVAAPEGMDGHRVVALRGRCEFLPKPIIFDALLGLLQRRVHRGIDDYVADRGFSAQEGAVIRHAVAGLDDEAICEKTACSRSTVKTYWARIYIKLGVKGRDQVLAHFARWLLAENEPSRRSSRSGA